MRNNLLIAATVGLMAVGGCATTSGNLSNSASRLERSAEALHDEARDQDARAGFQSDARELAVEARDFRRTVEDRDSSKEDVREAFNDLSKRYHAMRDEVERSQSREAEREFRPVTEAYLDVEREMRSRDSRRDRYAGDY
jgi:phage-related minor tail protein